MVERNCRTLKGRVGEGTELCAVVKANGYGHGAATCAAAALRGGATRLAVAAATEAEELRLYFPDTPILVMGALTVDELRVALASHAEIAVWREGFRDLCSRVSADLGRMTRVHLKLDSGMGRLGERDPDALIELARACEEDQRLDVAGVWTHFATADEEGDTFMAEQLAAFVPVAEASGSSRRDAPCTPRTAPPHFATPPPTSTWSAAGSPSMGWTHSSVTPPSTIWNRRSSCTPTWPT